MAIHLFARVRNDIQSKYIDKQGHKSITDEVKIRLFLDNIPNFIKRSITSHLKDNMTYNDIISK